MELVAEETAVGSEEGFEEFVESHYESYGGPSTCSRGSMRRLKISRRRPSAGPSSGGTVSAT
jgi:hypothetical protein